MVDLPSAVAASTLLVVSRGAHTVTNIHIPLTTPTPSLMMLLLSCILSRCTPPSPLTLSDVTLSCIKPPLPSRLQSPFSGVTYSCIKPPLPGRLPSCSPVLLRQSCIKSPLPGRLQSPFSGVASPCPVSLSPSPFLLLFSLFLSPTASDHCSSSSTISKRLPSVGLSSSYDDTHSVAAGAKQLRALL